MPKLIDRYGERVDHWTQYTGDAANVPTGSSVILPLTEFREFSGTWKAHAKAIGVRLSPTDDPALLVNDLDKLSLIAIEFPAFTDGRGYSSARLLRERYGWKGELRAVGDVLRDQIFLLSRSGFDTFALRDDQNVQGALAAFNDFSAYYQQAADRLVGSGSPLALAA